MTDPGSTSDAAPVTRVTLAWYTLTRSQRTAAAARPTGGWTHSFLDRADLVGLRILEKPFSSRADYQSLSDVLYTAADAALGCYVSWKGTALVSLA